MKVNLRPYSRPLPVQSAPSQGVIVPRFLPAPILRGSSVVRVGGRGFRVPAIARRVWIKNANGKGATCLILLPEDELHILMADSQGQVGQVDPAQFAGIKTAIITKYFSSDIATLTGMSRASVYRALQVT